MTPEAKKRKNQKKKLKQKQKKIAEKSASRNEESHETPESTISINFDDDSVYQKESDMTTESDVLPVSSSTNISPANDTQLEISDVRELHDELFDESNQHNITADTGDLPNKLVVESNSSITQSEPKVSQEDANTSSDFPSTELSHDAITVESNDNNEHAQKAAIFTVKEDASDVKDYEHYDSVIISSNDGANSHYSQLPSSSGGLISPEIASGSTPMYDNSIGTSDNDNIECHRDDNRRSLVSNHESSEDLLEEDDDLSNLQAHTTTEGEQHKAVQEATDGLFGSGTELPENVIKSSGDDASKLFQDKENNEKLPWEEDGERPSFDDNMMTSQEVTENSKEHIEGLPMDKFSNNSDSFTGYANKGPHFGEETEESSRELNTQESKGQDCCGKNNSDIKHEKFSDGGNHDLPSSAGVDIIEFHNDKQEENGNSFVQSAEESGEALPWEADDKNTDTTSEAQEFHEHLFAADESHEKLPWEISEGQPLLRTADSMHVNTGQNKEKKFSFLEEDDDLLDDDDSFLASSGEEEVTISDSNTTKLSPKPVEKKKASKYEPSTNQQSRIRQEQAQFTTTTGIVTPHQFHGLTKSALNAPVQQSNVQTMVGSKPTVVKDGRSIHKIDEEKKKSDAYDFPLEIISESSKKGHAKPVSVPTQRFLSGNSFSSSEKPISRSRKGSSNSNAPPAIPLTTQMPRSSRTNSAALQSTPNYAFPNPYNVQQLQQPSIQSGMPLPSPNIPPPTLQVETITSVPPIRARGISNASGGSATSFGARRSTQYGVNNGPSPVSPYGQSAVNLPAANKYAPVSPTVQQGQYPPFTQNIGPPAAKNPNFVKTHRGHTSSVSSYTPNQNEYASRYAPNNQQSYQVAHVSQPMMPVTENLNYPTQAYAASKVSKAQTAAIIQPPMNVQLPIGAVPSVAVQAPMNMQARANKKTHAVNLPPPVNMPHPANLPPPSNMSLTGIARQATNNVPSLQQESNAIQIDNEALIRRQFPIFHWSPANKVVYAVPSIPDQSHYMISSNFVQEIKVVSIDQIVKPKDMLKSFPGPLSSVKLKKKDLTKWIKSAIKNILEKDPSTDVTIWQLLEMKLSDGVNWNNISGLLYNSEELLMYLSQPFPNAEVIPNAYRLDVNCQMRVLTFLQTGNHDEALRLALGKRDYTIALLIGSLMGKEKWSEVIQKYLYEEFIAGPNDQKVLANFLFLIFQVFVGNSKMTIKSFYANKEASQWALANWKTIVAAVLINIPTNAEEPLSIPPVVLEFLIEFGIFLTKKGLNLAASTLFIIGNVPLSDQPVMADSDVIFETIGNPNAIESVLWGEIYEYIFSSESNFKGFSSILPQKILHASLLQEQGLTNLSTKYTDCLGSSMRKLPKKDALTINLTHGLNEVLTRLSESNTGWLAKPKLSSVWGQLDKSFNKYIGGDDIDALSKKNDKKKVFDGFTPGSSANSSTADLTQAFTPFQTQVTSQSYVDTTALLHNVHNPSNHGVLLSKPPHGQKISVEAGLPYTHRIGDSLQGSPQRIQTTQYTTVDPQMSSLRRVRTDQHATENILKGQQSLEKKPPLYVPQSGQNHGTLMEKSNSNAPSLFADFAHPPKFGRVSSNYMSSPDLVRRESIISTGSDFLPPPKIGAPKANSSQGSLMYSPSVEALPIEPLVPLDNEGGYNNSDNEDLEEGTPEHEYHTLEHKSNTDEITLNDSTDAAGETKDSEAPGFNDEENPLPTEVNIQATFPINSVKSVGDGVQQIDRIFSNGISSTDGSKIENVLPSNENEKSNEGLPKHASKPASSSYLPLAESVSVENKLLTQKEDVEIFNVTAPMLVEQHTLPPKLEINNAIKMHHSPYMPQAPVANTDAPTMPEASPPMFVGSSQVQVSTASPYFPIAHQTNNSAPFGSSETMSQSPINGDITSEDRFSPIKKAEVVERETFEPTIRRASTNQYRAFKPLESEVGKYNDIIEEESEDENMSAEEGENRNKKEKINEGMKKGSRSKDKDMDDKSNSWFGWLKKDTGDKKVYKAKLGHKNTLYYDEKLKRWVNKDATEEEKQKIVETSAPPPPPIVKRKDAGPKTKPRSGPISNILPPINVTSVTPNNPITGDPLPTKSAPPLLSGEADLDNSPPPSSPVSSISGVNLTGKKANGLDDILSLTGGPKPASTRRKKKATRGYVNVMNNIQ
ncbi:COPII coat assembly protein SEC16 SKDI_16G1900 [Saccharomyces kudriavzevii IFO 1802]|uniref:Protein transport protein sec16 n=1 Tax=Saccharomyces kudriavzevii (strain ATCC MYA-4449 / AS 2.2408 / CBS 8840 / NBRC 1802 / NCYC 2889) TaxID=226230 RepID=A0AA35JAU5_SACK1|nr:uncharacterized protein SKDI_16G1900 [Saccharomyces kudriavzevii IFO 1802]CAI4053330.1 hypothetical protein SKDI_16G1900 [Saccharomyces kudriavzevii IFO 1802]